MPFVLILFVLVELAMGSPSWLWAIAAAYVVGRTLHAFGMDSQTGSMLRTVGIALNHLVIVALAVAALMAAYRATGTDAVKSFRTHDVPAKVVPVG